MEQITESIFPEKQVVYATFWGRFAAMFIDGLVMGIPIVILQYSSNLGGILALVANWLYYALQESGPRQATLGKRAMGIIVTDLNGGRITFGQASGRFFGRYLSILILFIGFFMMLWDSRSQTLHDKMAGCLVISADK